MTRRSDSRPALQWSIRLRPPRALRALLFFCDPLSELSARPSIDSLSAISCVPLFLCTLSPRSLRPPVPLRLLSAIPCVLLFLCTPSPRSLASSCSSEPPLHNLSRPPFPLHPLSAISCVLLFLCTLSFLRCPLSTISRVLLFLCTPSPRSLASSCSSASLSAILASSCSSALPLRDLLRPPVPLSPLSTISRVLLFPCTPSPRSLASSCSSAPPLRDLCVLLFPCTPSPRSLASSCSSALPLRDLSLPPVPLRPLSAISASSCSAGLLSASSCSVDPPRLLFPHLSRTGLRLYNRRFRL